MPEQASVVIDWHYSGEVDLLLGTGATRTEKALGWAAGIIAASLYLYLYLTNVLDWAWWQYIVAGIIAFDIGGGVVANSLNSCKRFYHTPNRTDEAGYVRIAKNHMVFSALHIHPILIGLWYGENRWLYGVFWYIVMMGGTVGVLKVPLYLRRPVAMLIIMVALGVNLYGVEAVRGFEWLIPALFLKIIYGHLVREEPYRPVARKNAAA